MRTVSLTPSFADFTLVFESVVLSGIVYYLIVEKLVFSPGGLQLMMSASAPLVDEIKRRKGN